MHIAQKHLKIVGAVVYCGHRHVAQHVRELLGKGLMQVVRSSGFRNGFDREPIPFEDSESTCTYDGCIDVMLRETGRLEIEVWNGRMLNGEREDLRAKYTIEGEWWRIASLVKDVERAFSIATSQVMDREDEEERKLRHKRTAERLLAEFDIANQDAVLAS